MTIKSKNKNILIIWDLDGPFSSHYNSTNHDTLLWRGSPSSNEENIFSILKIIEKNPIFYREQYLKLIYDLGKLKINNTSVEDYLGMPEGMSYWWMTLFSEKCNYVKSPEIVNSIKMIALKKLLEENNYSHIIFVSNNSLIADSLNILTKSLDLQFEFKFKKLENTKRINMVTLFHKMPYAIQSLIWFSRHLYKRWALKGVGLNEWSRTKAKHTFVSYLFNNPPNSNNIIFESNFWPKLPNVFEDLKIETNWLHLYSEDKFLPTSKDAKNCLDTFNKSNLPLQTHATLHSFLTIKLIILTIKRWFKIRKMGSKVSKHIAIKSHYHWPLLKNDFNETFFGSNAIGNLLYFFLFQRAMSLLPQQSKGFYLQENQGWEFAFIHAWKSKGHGKKLFGCPHTNIRFWDLRYFFYQDTYHQNGKFCLPLPNYIALNSNFATQIYLEGGYDKKCLLEVESLRFLFLESDFNKTTVTKKQEIIGYEVLILGDSLKEILLQQMELLLLAQSYIDIDIKYVLKPHPLCPVSAEDYPDLNLTVIYDNIASIIDNYSIVYSSSTTSACIDAYCRGLEVCILLSLENLNLCPLRGSEGVCFVSTAQELAIKFNSFFELPLAKKTFKNYYYVDPSLPKWKKLLSI